MLGCCTWLQSSSNPANDIVDPSHLVVSVDVHTHLPETEFTNRKQEEVQEEHSQYNVFLFIITHGSLRKMFIVLTPYNDTHTHTNK